MPGKGAREGAAAHSIISQWKSKNGQVLAWMQMIVLLMMKMGGFQQSYIGFRTPSFLGR